MMETVCEKLCICMYVMETMYMRLYVYVMTVYERLDIYGYDRDCVYETVYETICVCDRLFMRNYICV